MPAWKFFEWMAYSEVEPWSEIRDDYRAASIVQAIVNVNRDDKKYPKPLPIENFLLKFGVQEEEEKPKQTWQEQKRIAQLWAMIFNSKAA